MIVGEYVADHCQNNPLNINTKLIEHFMKQEKAKISTLLKRERGENPYELKKEMQQIMMDKVGIFRNETDLTQAVEELKVLHQRSKNVALRNKISSSNPELVEAIRVPKMIKLAQCVGLWGHAAQGKPWRPCPGRFSRKKRPRLAQTEPSPTGRVTTPIFPRWNTRPWMS